jgi:hypothetical protein
VLSVLPWYFREDLEQLTGSENLKTSSWQLLRTSNQRPHNSCAVYGAMTDDNENNTASSTNDGAEEDNSCPICLDNMSNPDILHPIQCPTKCNFNFCIHCMSSLLSSSKDDYQMASDGNRHVKVHLNCPNCRADISKTIEGTIKQRRKAAAEAMQSVPDSELSAKELQCKYWKDGDDLILGADKTSKPSGEEPLEIDTTLFGGLEFAMSEQEQKYVTKLMTSGYPDQLCQGAQILAGVSELLRKGKTPAMQNNTNDNTRATPPNSAAAATVRTTAMLQGGRSNTPGIGPSRTRDGGEPPVSNFQRQMEQKARDKLRRPLPARMPLSVTLSTAEFEKMALHSRQQAGLVDPSISGGSDKKLWWRGLLGDATGLKGNATLKFVDDQWDGTIADAFARAQIGPQAGNRKKATVQGRVTTKNPVERMSINKILAIGENEKREKHDNNGSREGMLQPSRTQRVLVASVRGQAGKSGIMKGDVVTHVNGEVFIGDAAALNALLVNSYEEQGKEGVVMIVVNAEECTAEALRLRSRVR